MKNDIKFYKGKYKVKIVISAPIKMLKDKKQCQVVALEEFCYDFADGTGGQRVLPGWRFNTYPEFLTDSKTKFAFYKGKQVTCQKAGDDWSGCGDCENEDPNTCPASAQLAILQQPEVLAAAGNKLFDEFLEKVSK